MKAIKTFLICLIPILILGAAAPLYIEKNSGTGTNITFRGTQILFTNSNGAFNVISNSGISGTSYPLGSTPPENPGSYVTAKEGGYAGGGFSGEATNCFVRAIEGAFAGGFFAQSSNSFAFSAEGSLSAINSDQSFDCFVEANCGFSAGGFLSTKNSDVDVGNAANGVGYFEECTNISVNASSGSSVTSHSFRSKDITVTASGGAVVGSYFTDSSTNTVTAFNSFLYVNGTGLNNMAESYYGSFVFGSVTGGERLYGESPSAPAFVFGRDVAGTNNATFGLHYTNAIPLSFAYGVNGATQFGVTSNGVASVRGAIKVGAANAATITNILSGSATLNFASQSVGGSEDLAITVTGAKDGDAVSLGYESAVATGIVGSFSAFASNGVVFVRFISTGATQNPASGVFRVVVTEF